MSKIKKYRIEFHTHTTASSDSILTKYFIILMCKLRKIDCLAITDHNEIKYAEKNKDFFEKNNIKIIVGEEIFTKDGEIIGLYLNKKIEPGMSAEETIKEIKKQNGYVYIPHPYEPFRSKTVLKETCIKKNKQNIDLIEIHNGRNRTNDISAKQLEIANKYKINYVIGSDAHTFIEIGRNYILVDEIPTRENIIDCIKKGELVKSKCILLSHQLTKCVKVIKMISGGQINELYRIVIRRCKKRDI